METEERVKNENRVEEEKGMTKARRRWRKEKRR